MRFSQTTARTRSQAPAAHSTMILPTWARQQRRSGCRSPSAVACRTLTVVPLIRTLIIHARSGRGSSSAARPRQPTLPHCTIGSSAVSAAFEMGTFAGVGDGHLSIV